MRNRHVGWDLEIAGDIEHPKLMAGFGKLSLQIADVVVIELAKVYAGAVQSIVPPNCVCIAFYEFKKSLYDCFFECIASRTSIGIGGKVAGSSVKKIEKARRKIFESFVPQR